LVSKKKNCKFINSTADLLGYGIAKRASLDSISSTKERKNVGSLKQTICLLKKVK